MRAMLAVPWRGPPRRSRNRRARLPPPTSATCLPKAHEVCSRRPSRSPAARSSAAGRAARRGATRPRPRRSDGTRPRSRRSPAARRCEGQLAPVGHTLAQELRRQHGWDLAWVSTAVVPATGGDRGAASRSSRQVARACAGAARHPATETSMTSPTSRRYSSAHAPRARPRGRGRTQREAEAPEQIWHEKRSAPSSLCLPERLAGRVSLRVRPIPPSRRSPRTGPRPRPQLLDQITRRDPSGRGRGMGLAPVVGSGVPGLRDPAHRAAPVGARARAPPGRSAPCVLTACLRPACRSR